jgi:ATP-dependent DNA ligase
MTVVLHRKVMHGGWMLDYTGAGSRIDPERGLRLDARRWAWQPKVDGTYIRISTDSRGRVCRILTRGLREIREGRELYGILAGPPDSVLHGELEAHTEAGNRIAACRGWANVHLFDLTYLRGRDVSSLPYERRRGELIRSHSVIEGDGLARVRMVTDCHGRHQLETSRKYVAAAPRDLRRFPVVPQVRGSGLELWSQYVEREQGEGLVAVRLDAPAGVRGAKRKCKASDTIDAVVVSVDPGGNYCAVMRGSERTTVSCRGKYRPTIGDMVEVAHDGRYEATGALRFARLVRQRADLT